MISREDDSYGIALGAVLRNKDDEQRTTTFALWTSKATECAVRITTGDDDDDDDDDAKNPRTFRLEAKGAGFFAAEVAEAPHGARYVFLLDGKESRDPYATFLPDGVDVDAPAMVWCSSYEWKHPLVTRPLREHVIYELHIGTFTEEGTYTAAAARLEHVRALGVTAIELMPIAAFPGARGWGYDGVAHFAPYAPYGNPDELRAFVDCAHGLGLAVFLDVVYNHFGPSGNVLYAYSDEYFSSTHETTWGDAPNFERSAMRRYVVRNVLYWLNEFRFDGLRFDAVHAIVDEHKVGKRHICREIADEVAKLPAKRLLIAEDERNDPTVICDYGFDGIWADDLHHQIHVTLTSEADGYYAAYKGKARDIAETIENAWFYRGATFPLSDEPRGKPADGLSAETFLYCIQNHDQVGNRAFGARLTETLSRGRASGSNSLAHSAFEAATIALLFLPMTPIIFMGQEWAASTPFLYFTDHDEELGRSVTEGRRKEFAQFEVFADDEMREKIPDPQSKTTFEKSRLDWSERAKPEHARILEAYRSLLKLRATDPVLRASGRESLRARADEDGDLLIIERWLGTEERTLVVSFSDTAQPFPANVMKTDARLLYSTNPAFAIGDELAPYGVVLFAQLSAHLLREDR